MRFLLGLLLGYSIRGKKPLLSYSNCDRLCFLCLCYSAARDRSYTTCNIR